MGRISISLCLYLSLRVELPSFERLVHFSDVFGVKASDIELVQVEVVFGEGKNGVGFLLSANSADDFSDDLRVKHSKTKKLLNLIRHRSI